MIDPALLRPGRLELHVEISLPDEAGRTEILNIHTAKMREHGYLAENVSLTSVAMRSKNYSGAELAGVVRAAQSYAVSRQVDVHNLQKSLDSTESISISTSDFDNALLEVKPSFGFDCEKLDNCVEHGVISYSPEFSNLLCKCSGFVEQVRSSRDTPVLTMLLAGDEGCGKTALSAHLALKSGFPFVRRITSEAYIGDSEQLKATKIARVFDDAANSPLSLIILDDLERLVDYVSIGPRFSNVVLQALFSLLKKKPVKQTHRMVVIATTSDMTFANQTKLLRAFNIALKVPMLTSKDHFKAVLGEATDMSSDLSEELSTELDGQSIGIQTLLQVTNMASKRETPIRKDVFLECLWDTAMAMKDDCFAIV